MNSALIKKASKVLLTLAPIGLNLISGVLDNKKQNEMIAKKVSEEVAKQLNK